MKLKSKIVLALLATSSAAFAQTAPAAPEVTYNVGVVSQYRYRGIAQTHGDAALQGGVDYANANGFYAGAWGSTIKWIKDANEVKDERFLFDLFISILLTPLEILSGLLCIPEILTNVRNETLSALDTYVRKLRVENLFPVDKAGAHKCRKKRK